MVNVKIIVVIICCISITAHGHAVNRIIDGTDVDYDVSFLVYITSPTNSNFRCTGTVLGRRHVLTAASCFNSYPNSAKFEVNHNNNILRIKKKIIHEDFIAGKQGPNDIALLKLYNAIHAPTVLRIVKNLPNTGILYGWGVTSADSTSYPYNPHLTVVTIKSSYSCQSLLPDTPIDYTNICSPELEGACFGDVGGPLITLTDYPPKLIGIVTWGFTSCDEPTVYTNMMYYQNWIGDRIKE